MAFLIVLKNPTSISDLSPMRLMGNSIPSSLAWTKKIPKSMGPSCLATGDPRVVGAVGAVILDSFLLNISRTYSP
jgi:hypothetical protein